MPYKNYSDCLANARKYYGTHKDERKIYFKQWKNKNYKRWRDSINNWQEKNKSHYEFLRKNGELKRLYGIDLNEYNRMFQIQGGCCAICKRHQSEFKYALHVDHNHKTKRVRGLLCWKCNSNVGFHEKWSIQIDSYLKKFDESICISEREE